MTEVQLSYADGTEKTVRVRMRPDEVWALSPGELDTLGEFLP